MSRVRCKFRWEEEGCKRYYAKYYETMLKNKTVQPERYKSFFSMAVSQDEESVHWKDDFSITYRV